MPYTQQSAIFNRLLMAPTPFAAPTTATDWPAFAAAPQVKTIWGVSRPVGRVLCARLRGAAVIHLGLPLPTASCGLPASIGRAALDRSRREPLAPLLTLPRVGFTEPPQSPAALVVSYTTVSPLPRLTPGRFAFCGTVPRVTPGRRYRPPCPVEPGPSSPGLRPARPPGRLTRAQDTLTAAPSGERTEPAPTRPARAVARAGRVSARQQFGLRRIGPAKAPRVPGPTAPYWASPPKVLPLRMLPNSHRHRPPTLAWVKYGKKCPGPCGGSTHPAPELRSQFVLSSLALVSVMNWIWG